MVLFDTTNRPLKSPYETQNLIPYFSMAVVELGSRTGNPPPTSSLLSRPIRCRSTTCPIIDVNPQPCVCPLDCTCYLQRQALRRAPSRIDSLLRSPLFHAVSLTASRQRVMPIISQTSCVNCSVPALKTTFTPPTTCFNFWTPNGDVNVASDVPVLTRNVIADECLP